MAQSITMPKLGLTMSEGTIQNGTRLKATLLPSAKFFSSCPPIS